MWAGMETTGPVGKTTLGLNLAVQRGSADQSGLIWNGAVSKVSKPWCCDKGLAGFGITATLSSHGLKHSSTGLSAAALLRSSTDTTLIVKCLHGPVRKMMKICELLVSIILCFVLFPNRYNRFSDPIQRIGVRAHPGLFDRSVSAKKSSRTARGSNRDNL